MFSFFCFFFWSGVFSSVWCFPKVFFQQIKFSKPLWHFHLRAMTCLKAFCTLKKHLATYFGTFFFEIAWQFCWSGSPFGSIREIHWHFQMAHLKAFGTLRNNMASGHIFIQYGPDKQLSPCEIQSCSDMSKMLGHPLLVPKIYQKMVKTHSKSLQ